MNKNKHKIKKNIFIASDHAGYYLKEQIKLFLSKKRKNFQDLGTKSIESVDYPDFAHLLSKKIKNSNHLGILICGSGIGMDMAANKHKNIRAALCYNIKSTKLSREHNNANVMAIGARLTKKKVVLKCIITFLNTNFKGGRHNKRVKKI